MPDAIFVVDDRLTTVNRRVIFDFAVENRLPAMYELDFLVRDGGLMSHGPDLGECLDRAAALIDRILKGAVPQTCPSNSRRDAGSLSTSRLQGPSD